MRRTPFPPGSRLRMLGARPIRGVPGPYAPEDSLASRAYPPLIWLLPRANAAAATRALHRRLVVRVEEALWVVAELEVAAASAEPVRLAVMLELEVGGGRVDLHPADRIDLDRHVDEDSVRYSRGV